MYLISKYKRHFTALLHNIVVEFRESQSRMDNPETQATLGTRYRMKTNKKHSIENYKRQETQIPQKRKRKKKEVNPGVHEG